MVVKGPCQGYDLGKISLFTSVDVLVSLVELTVEPSKIRRIQKKNRRHVAMNLF